MVSYLLQIRRLLSMLPYMITRPKPASRAAMAVTALPWPRRDPTCYRVIDCNRSSESKSSWYWCDPSLRFQMWTVPSFEPEYISRYSWLDSKTLISPLWAWLTIRFGTCLTVDYEASSYDWPVLHPRRFLSLEALINIVSSSIEAKEVTTSRWGGLRAAYTCSRNGAWYPSPIGTILWFRQPMKSFFCVDFRAKTSSRFSMFSIGLMQKRLKINKRILTNLCF